MGVDQRNTVNMENIISTRGTLQGVTINNHDITF